MRRVRAWTRAGARALVLTLMAVALAGCPDRHLTFLDPQGPVAAAQRWHLFEVVLLVMIVVLPVLIATPLLAWRYRYGNKSARYAPKWDFSWPLEFVIWGVPAGIVAVLAVLLWHSTHALDPYDPLSPEARPLRVQVVGLDWKWLFIYPDEGIATVGELAFPADRTLALELTSDTVMQSFFVPALGSQIYAMAGMVTRLHLSAYGPGRFEGENTQYNGNGFQRQKFVARAMTPADFETWLQRVRTEGVALDDNAWRTLSEDSTTQQARSALPNSAMPPGAIYFNALTPGLFDAIVQRFRHGPAQPDGPLAKNAG